MRATQTLKSVLVASILVTGALSHAAPAKSAAAAEAVAKKEAKETKENSAISQALLNTLLTLKSFGCGWEIEGSIDGEKTNIDLLKGDCMLQLSDKSDLILPILEQEVDSKGRKEGFNIAVAVKAKALYVRILTQKKGADLVTTVRSYSAFDKATKKWTDKPILVSASVLNGDQALNAELFEARFHGIDVKLTENSEKPGQYKVSGTCKADRKEFSFVTNTFEFKPAKCYLEGTFGPKDERKFNFGFVNATSGAVLP
ncbi:hypothetical protein [Bdellovibrio sp. HCB2-146]|uniref:hypothetical protein n=1 Tax=Bdellovibrio sp. HCB2-146 TaxID=3394362 RepID=UPI0039BD087D